MKLLLNTYQQPGSCKECEKIAVKHRAIKKEEDNIARWKRDGSRYKASIEKAENAIDEHWRRIEDLEKARDAAKNDLSGNRSSHRARHW